MIVTLDADFHALLAIGEATNPSVIRIRNEGLKAGAMVTLLLGVLQRCEADVAAGAAITVQGARVRVRLLPLGGGAHNG